MTGFTPGLCDLSTLEIFSSPPVHPTTSISVCLGTQEAQLTGDGDDSSQTRDEGDSLANEDETQRTSQIYNKTHSIRVHIWLQYISINYKV